MFNKLVLDLSHWNGNIDFYKLKQSGIWGVILKVGGAEKGKFYKDSKFNINYENAIKNGLHVGGYWFTGMQFSPEEESKTFICYCNGKKFDLPLYLDFEVSTPQYKRQNTDFCIDFINNMYSLGKWFVGIYASDIFGFKDRLNKNRLLDYTWWVARYGEKPPQYALENCHIHQFTSSGKVSGINGKVDYNYCYRDFPTVIISGHYNGW